MVAPWYAVRVDALARDDLETARALTPEQKLRQALELMAAGFRLQRAALRQRHPDATPQEIEHLFEQWLFEND